MRPDPIVTPAILEERPDLQILEVRWRLGTPREAHRAAYDAGHLPGAVYVDLEDVATGPHRPGRGRHPLPSPKHVAARLADLGVDLAAPCLVVDDATGMHAARLWWLLDALGVEAYLLDGGLAAIEGPRCTTPCTRPPLPPAPALSSWPPGSVWQVDELARHLEEVVVLDARARERYLGHTEPIDPLAGHIPGSRAMPLDELLASGRFPSPEEARVLFEPLASRPLVASCGSGITACALVALGRRAGVEVALLEGSWSGWCEDPTRPVCTLPCGNAG